MAQLRTFRVCIAAAIVFFIALMGRAAQDEVTLKPKAPAAGESVSPVQRQYVIEKGLVEKLKRQAYAASPELQRRESEGLQLHATIEKLQSSTREAVDRYLKQKGLKEADLPSLRLTEISDTLMRIQPYKVVLNKEIQPVVIGALRHGQPVFPLDFAKEFPGQKPAEVPEQKLLAFYLTHLKDESARAQKQLNELLDETKTPEEIVKALKELTLLKCALKVYVIYLESNTPANLKTERHKLMLIERALKGVK